MDNRAEIKAFLSSRRAKITPEQAGCYRPRYLNIQRPDYLAAIRQGFAGITGQPDHVA
jgi:hypothetical protein